jgi:hypothetical protein
VIVENSKNDIYKPFTKREGLGFFKRGAWGSGRCSLITQSKRQRMDEKKNKKWEIELLQIGMGNLSSKIPATARLIAKKEGVGTRESTASGETIMNAICNAINQVIAKPGKLLGVKWASLESKMRVEVLTDFGIDAVVGGTGESEDPVEALICAYLDAANAATEPLTITI